MTTRTFVALTATEKAANLEKAAQIRKASEGQTGPVANANRICADGLEAEVKYGRVTFV